MYATEFQNRLLPRAQVLLSLNERDKIDNITDISKVVCDGILILQLHVT